MVVVDDLDELIEACAAHDLRHKRPAGDGLAVINISGGEVALTCDLGPGSWASAFAPHVPQRSIACGGLPAFATPGNPLDATGAAVGDPAMYARAMRALLDDPRRRRCWPSRRIARPGLSAKARAQLSEAGRTRRQWSARSATKPIVFYSNVGRSACIR